MIMKKNLWVLIAVLCMAACSQSDEVIVERPITDNDFESTDGRVVIQLGGQDVSIKSSIGVTRAPLDELYNQGTNTATTQLGIFALATNDATNGTTITDANRATAWGDTDNYGILLNNIKGEVTTWPTGVPKGVASPDAEKITLYKGDVKGGVYYYPLQKKYDYTFYGYAPYQAGTISATETGVKFNTIDGSQDIIWQEAKAAQIEAGKILVKENTYNDQVLTGYKAQYIRQLKYHYELNGNATDYPWIPNIAFKHILAQLRFSAIAANDQSAEDKASATRMTVKDITIKGHGTAATLNILTGAITFTNTGDLTMRKATDDGTNITFEDGAQTEVAVQYDEKFYATDATRTNPLVQGYLMVKPDVTTYTMDITINVENVEGVPRELSIKGININAPEPPADSGNTEAKFYAGKYYNVRIGVYATQEVNVTATLDTWASGGDDIYLPVE